MGNEPSSVRRPHFRRVAGGTSPGLEIGSIQILMEDLIILRFCGLLSSRGPNNSSDYHQPIILPIMEMHNPKFTNMAAILLVTQIPQMSRTPTEGFDGSSLDVSGHVHFDRSIRVPHQIQNTTDRIQESGYGGRQRMLDTAHQSHDHDER